MTVCTANFDAGTLGNNILTTDLGSGTPWDVRDAPGAGSMVYDNNFCYGRLANKFISPGQGSAFSLAWTTAIGALTDHYGRLYVYFDSYPSGAGDNDLRFIEGTGFRFSMRSVENGKIIRVFSDSGFLGDTTSQYLIDQWIRLEWHIVHSATVGVVELRLYNNADSTSITETVTFNNTNTGTSLSSIKFGDMGGASSAATTCWIDNIIAGATGYPVAAESPGKNTQISSLKAASTGLRW